MIRKIMVLSIVMIMVFNASMCDVLAEDAVEYIDDVTMSPMLDEDVTDEFISKFEESEHVIDDDDFIAADDLLAKFGKNVNDISKNDEPVFKLFSSNGDKLEPNNSKEDASVGCINHKIKATIHDLDDMDWYKIDVSTIDKNYSLVLTDIPSGCNYDMVLLSEDLSSGYASDNEGTVPEEIYITANKQTTYYVVVGSSGGYSDKPYTLYLGKTIVYGDTGWRDTGLTFNFGNSACTLPMQYYNLSSDNTIPNDNAIYRFQLSDSGNGAYWRGLYKYIRAENGDEYWQYGKIDTFDLPTDKVYNSKQRWGIYGSIEQSSYFVWRPKIYIMYMFFAKPETMRFI